MADIRSLTEVLCRLRKIYKRDLRFDQLTEDQRKLRSNVEIDKSEIVKKLLQSINNFLRQNHSLLNIGTDYDPSDFDKDLKFNYEWFRHSDDRNKKRYDFFYKPFLKPVKVVEEEESEIVRQIRKDLTS